jgi:alpha-1,2-mannosyltransferase
LVPGAVVAAIALVFLPMTPAYDLNVFLRAGQNVAEGLPVYPSIGTPSVYSGAAFVYPYFAAFPFVLLAGLSASAATWLFFAISGGCVVAVSSIGVEKGHLRALLVLCCAFTITGLQLGALSPLLFAGTLLLWRMRDRPRAFILAGPIIAAKLFLAPLLLWLLLARRYRALAWACAGLGAMLALGFLGGPISAGEYARMLSQLSAHEARLGMSLVGALMNWGLSLGAGQALAGLVALALLVWAHRRYHRARDERVLFSAGVLASLMLTPVLWSHYLVLLAACLLVFDARPRWLIALALASWALAPPHNIPDTRLIGYAAVGGLVLLLASLSPPARALRRRMSTLLGAAADRRLDPANAGAHSTWPAASSRP